MVLVEILDVMRKQVGDFCIDFCNIRDSNRITEMERKSTDATKLSRKRLRAVRKGFEDKDKERHMEQDSVKLFQGSL